MNKKLIIIGILGLAGAGAFLYFKSKNKLGKNDTPTPTSTLSEPPTQSNVTIGEVTLTTPVEVVENALKISEAKSIAREIFNLRNKRKNVNFDFTQINTINTINTGGKIKELNKNLALLGYKEVNGLIQKI
jgi:hypothetical protein